MGSTEPAVLEAQDKLQAMGILTDTMRIRSLPFSPDVRDFIQSHERNYVLELNLDGQLHQILSIEHCDMTHLLISLCHIDGLPMTAEWIIKSVIEKEQ
jgi:2-oxoglutarate ferredoxin oxidoreductase subunit alpha